MSSPTLSPQPAFAALQRMPSASTQDQCPCCLGSGRHAHFPTTRTCSLCAGTGLAKDDDHE